MLECKDLSGEKFGKLTVIKLHHKKRCYTPKGKSVGFKKFWLCQCDCGNITIVEGCALKNGNTKSCGCYRMELLKHNFVIHNKTNTRLFRIWDGMKTRCYNHKSNRYKNYGGRGIKICDEWLNDFMSFYNWAVSNGYNDNLSIDRVNNNGNYEPSNCRWATAKEQANNRTNNKKGNVDD